MRALEIARDNQIPYVSFVESAGADLRVGKGGGGRMQTGHFAESGRFFYDLIELSKMRVPTICVVFGSSTAGGAYQPGLSDYNILVKDQSKIFLAGPPLVKMATGEESDDETLGGAQMHAEVSGLGDYFADDEMDALRHVSRGGLTPQLAKEGAAVPHFKATSPGTTPRSCSASSVATFAKASTCVTCSPGSLMVRDSKSSRRRYGTTLVCGWASIHGYPVGILGNNGVIHPKAAEKAGQFIQLCNQIDVPLVFIQNITGYMVGKDAEAEGIIKKGSQMLNAVTNSTVPHLTLIIGSSYGAGTYGMSGRAFNNRFTFLWPTAKIAVMGPKQIAGVMSQVRRGQAERQGVAFDEEEDAKVVAMVEEAQEQGSLALAATSAVSDDGIIDPRDTRTVLGLCLSVVRSRPIEGATSYGVFRL